MFQLRLKTALTNKAEILQSFIVDYYVNRCDDNFIYWRYLLLFLERVC